MTKVAVVVAHHHDNFDFLKEWEQQFSMPNIELYICYDRDIAPPELPKWAKGKIFTRKDIKKDLKDNSWIIPFATSAIKSYGFYKAWQDGFDVILTIDNDCFPDQEYFTEKHLEALELKQTLDWIKTVDGMHTRGFPYAIREDAETVLNHGLWSNIPDLDAPTGLLNPNYRLSPKFESERIPRFNFYPMCGMNLAFKSKITPIMYFGIQGPSWPYDRFDDIWAGIFSKKIIDHLRFAVRSGAPSVEHRKQSNVFDNLRKETPGIILHEKLWVEVQKIVLTKDNVLDCYIELADKLPVLNDYLKDLKKAMKIWASLFKTI